MASISVHNLDEELIRRLGIRAEQNGTSMEQEARIILSDALFQEPRDSRNLAEAVRSRFEPYGGVELQLPTREPMREPPTFR